MSDTNTAPGEQPAQPDTIPAAGEQPAAQDPAATLESLDQQQLGDLLFGEKKEPAEPAATAPEEAPAPKPDTGAQPPVENPPAASEDSLRRLALGGVPLSERQQLAEVTRMIRSGEAATQIEALQKMGVLNLAESAPPTGEQPDEDAPPAATPAVQAPNGVSTIETTIAELRAQRKQAKADFDADEEDRLTTAIEDQLGLLAEARIRSVSQQAEASTYQEKYISAVDQMEERFPWAVDPESREYKALDDKITAARVRNDAALQDPNFILSFASEIAQLVAPQAPTPPPKPPATPSRVIGAGVAPGHSDAHVPTPEEARQLMHSASKQELAAALGWGG
jgi:hypothetical protein